MTTSCRRSRDVTVVKIDDSPSRESYGALATKSLMWEIGRCRRPRGRCRPPGRAPEDRMTVSTADDQQMTTEGLVAVVGGGAWGTTLAALASARGATTLWAREPEVVTSIREHHENRRFLSGCELPAGLSATAELEVALADARIVIVAVPAQHMRAVMERASTWLARDALIVSVTKGIEVSRSQRMTQVLDRSARADRRQCDRRAGRAQPGPRGHRRAPLGDHRRLHRRGPRHGDPAALPARRSASTRAPTSWAARSAAR